jgi:predicted RNase H-like HicB family nuclease
MAKDHYRILLSHDAARDVYLAHAPELGDCRAEGPTRAEAIAHVEEEITAQIDNLRDAGREAPRPLDQEPLSGELQAQISPTLRRELLWQAQVEGIDLGQLVGELLAAALERRQMARPPRPRTQPQAGGQPRAERDGNGQQPLADGERRPPLRDDRGGRLREGQGARYHGIMEDRANFIEYVRSLESGGGGPPRRRGGHGRHK